MTSMKGVSSYMRSIWAVQQCEIVLLDDSSNPSFTFLALSKS